MAWHDYGFPYDEAILKSLCFKCVISDSCFKPDTRKRKGYNFKPVIYCTRFMEE